MSSKGQDKIYQMITDKIIKALEDGVVPWQKGWRTSGGLPRSMSSNKYYRGSNVLILWLHGYNSPWWGTYDQIQTLGGQVRKGEHGEVVTFWNTFQVPDPDGELDEKGRPKMRTIPFMRYHRVFNACQADGLPDKYYPAKNGEAPEEVADAEVIMKEYFSREGAPSLAWDGGNRAYYRGREDGVHLPARDSFKDSGHLYDTWFHEATHSTGHESRMNRPGVVEFDHFGSEKYGKEELCAEMGAAFLAAMTGTDVHFDNEAAYIGSWLKAIQGNHKLVVQAGAQAQHAVDHILGVEYENGDES